MNKLKKKSKTKGLALGIAILSSAAVVSTGFAAWVIGGGDTQTAADGTVTADEISNAEHTISDLKFTSNAIYFGAPTSPTKTDSTWLTNTSDKKETLTVSGTFTVKHVKNSDTVATLFDSEKSFFEETTAGDDAKIKYATYNESGDKKYVVDMAEKIFFSEGKPSKLEAGNAYVYKTSTELEGDLQYAFDIVFGWGSGFDRVNPYEYFNKTGKTESLVSEATSKISDLHEMNATFAITIATK